MSDIENFSTFIRKYQEFCEIVEKLLGICNYRKIKYIAERTNKKKWRLF